jgi:hypothetical protein
MNVKFAQHSKLYTRDSFQGLPELAYWLSLKSIYYKMWGKSSSKNLEHLWSEILAGESLLCDRFPWRRIVVVRLFVLNGGRCLVEKEPGICTDKVNSRSKIPSKNNRIGEPIINAVSRCFDEEFNMTTRCVLIKNLPVYRGYVDLDSASYPGLYTRYFINDVAYKVTGLPDYDFYTTDSRTSSLKRTHYWGWENIDDCNCIPYDSRIVVSKIGSIVLRP